MKRTKPQKQHTRTAYRYLPASHHAANAPRQFQTTVPASPPSSWPSISACLIVKNEADNLRPCLESLGDLASEIIVVDTGSTDDTVEIAREMGAKVFHFQWINDFAAARNESLKHATREWIFWLDADDRLSPTAVAQIKAAVASGIADAYGCLVASKTNASSVDVTEHVRLFRNGLGVQFGSSIHEAVTQSIASLGLRLASTDIEVEHTGYQSMEIRRTKAQRNLQIIEAQLALHPDEVDLIFYRGQSRGLVDDASGMEADLQRFLALTKRGEQFDLRRFWAHASLVSLFQATGLKHELEECLGRALEEFPGHPMFLVHRSQVQMAAGTPAAAVESLRTARKALQSPVRGLKPTELAIEKSLAEAYHALGNLREAINWAERARGHDRDSTATVCFLAKLYSEADRLSDAERVLQPHLPAATAPEPWLIMAEVRAEQKRWSEALSAVEEAKRLGLGDEAYRALLARLKTGEAQSAGEAEDASPVARLKAAGIALLRTGEHLKAAEAFAAAVRAAPSDAESYKYLAAALKALGQEEQALEAWRLATLCQVPA